MTAKMSASRKRAFLTALANSGNQTLAAERAKVSRSWVQLHRSSDPAFDADCREAIAVAKAMLRDDAARRPADGRWRWQDGHELVVSGTHGGRTQIRRAKLSQWTARTEARFLAALAGHCNVKLACREVGVWPPSAYAHRKRWPDFAGRWDAAVEVGRDELELRMFENIEHFLDPEAPVPDAPMAGVTVAEAIRVLGMYERRDRERMREAREER